ncbi:MAG: hypothetical protein R3B48_01420 [Kofleriaceae bacterium]
MMPSVTLWRPVGAYELRLIVRASFRAFPPRLPEQPIFYPVCNEAYAIDIARAWNLDDASSGFAGFVTRFDVALEVVARYQRQIVGGGRHEELWIPAAELAAFCEAFVAPIAVTHGWLGARFPELAEWQEPVGELVGERLTRAVELIASGELLGGPRTLRAGG